MQITINLLELAAKLAYDKLRADYDENNKGKSQEEILQMIFTENDNGDFIYTDEAQEVFNEYYGEFYNTILKSEV